MAVIKVMDDKYEYESDVIKLINYVIDISKCEHLIGGGRNILGEIFSESDSIASQFLAVQRGRGFTRRVYHVIISFDMKIDDPDCRLAYNIGYAISNLYSAYQSVFVVHENTEQLHLHIVLNNCPVLITEGNLTYNFNRTVIEEMVDRMIDGHLGLV